MNLLIITRPSSTTYISSAASPSRKITSFGAHCRSRESAVRKLISMLDSFCSSNSRRLSARSTRKSGSPAGRPPSDSGGRPDSEKKWVRLRFIWRSLPERLFQKVQ